MMKTALFYGAVSALISLLIIAQSRAAEINFLAPYPMIESLADGVSTQSQDQQAIWPLLPDSLFYKDLSSSLVAQAQDSIKLEVQKARQENEVSWQSVFASAPSFHVITNAALSPVRDQQNLSYDILHMQRQDLALLAVLPSEDSLINTRHLHQNLGGMPYVIWPHTTGFHPPDRLIAWPLSGHIVFAHDRIDMTGQLTLRTDDYLAEMHFADDNHHISLSFATASHINHAVFHSPATLTFKDKVFESWVLLAQLFGDGTDHSHLPLWGQFTVLEPDMNSPVKGHFSSLP